jgi:hypothetical protein
MKRDGLPSFLGEGNLVEKVPFFLKKKLKLPFFFFEKTETTFFFEISRMKVGKKTK